MDAVGAALLTAMWLTTLWWSIRPSAQTQTVTETAEAALASRPSAADRVFAPGLAESARENP